MRRPNTEKPIPNESALYESAVRALARRARSIGEVRALLAKKRGSKQDIDAVLARLRDNGYLDDKRFARAFASARKESDLHGKIRVRRDLLARRVHPEVAEEAVRAAFEKSDEGALVRQYLRRKVHLPQRVPSAPEALRERPSLKRPLLKPSQMASLYRRLLRAGFRSDTIVRELKAILRGSDPVRNSGPEGTGENEAVSLSWDEVLDSLSDGEPGE